MGPAALAIPALLRGSSRPFLPDAGAAIDELQALLEAWRCRIARC
jgi:hypothetical protein